MGRRRSGNSGGPDFLPAHHAARHHHAGPGPGPVSERIRAGKRQLDEDRKNISLDEQCCVLRAAVEDLLRLAGDPPGHELSGKGTRLVLRTPAGEWRLELSMRERSLRGTRKVLHGRSRWLLSGFDRDETFDDLAGLMRSLNAHLRGDEMVTPEPAHLARRLSHQR